MPDETWVIRPAIGSVTVWDGGDSVWDEGIVPVPAAESISTWDGEIGGETWTQRQPGTLP